MVVDAVNLTPSQGASTSGLPTGTVNSADLSQGNLFLNPTNSFSSYGLDFGGSDSSFGMYSPLGYAPKRVRNTYMQEMKQSGYTYENRNISAEDVRNLKHMSDMLDEYRFLGKRWINEEQVAENLTKYKESGKGVALYFTNCVEDGFKNPKLPEHEKYSFANLKNPLRLAKTLRSVDYTTPNDKINLLSDIAIKEKSPEMVVALLKATSDGMGMRVDSETAMKLLIQSKSQFDNEGDYHKFITNVDKAYEKMYPGESLKTYIKDNYKSSAQKTAPVGGFLVGALAGRFAFGGWRGALLTGAASGLITGSFNFGRNDNGEKLMSALTEASTKSHDVNLKKYAFGGLSSISMPLTSY